MGNNVQLITIGGDSAYSYNSNIDSDVSPTNWVQQMAFCVPFYVTRVKYTNVRLNVLMVTDNSQYFYGQLDMVSSGSSVSYTISNNGPSVQTTNTGTLSFGSWYWFGGYVYRYGSYGSYGWKFKCAVSDKPDFISNVSPTEINDTTHATTNNMGYIYAQIDTNSGFHAFECQLGSVHIYKANSSMSSKWGSFIFSPYDANFAQAILRWTVGSTSNVYSIRDLLGMNISDIVYQEEKEAKNPTLSTTSEANTSVGSTTTQATKLSNYLATNAATIGAKLNTAFVKPIKTVDDIGHTKYGAFKDLLNGTNDIVTRTANLIMTGLNDKFQAVFKLGLVEYADALQDAIKLLTEARSLDFINWFVDKFGFAVAQKVTAWARPLYTGFRAVRLSFGADDWIDIGPYVWRAIKFLEGINFPGLHKEISTIDENSPPTIPFPVHFYASISGLSLNVHISQIMVPLWYDTEDPLFSALPTKVGAGMTWYSLRSDGVVLFGDSWPYYLAIVLLIILGVEAPSAMNFVLNHVGTITSVFSTKNNNTMLNSVKSVVDTIESRLSASWKTDVTTKLGQIYDFTDSLESGISTIIDYVDSLPGDNATVIQMLTDIQTTIKNKIRMLG